MLDSIIMIYSLTLCFVLCSRLRLYRQVITPDALFTLFGTSQRTSLSLFSLFHSHFIFSPFYSCLLAYVLVRALSYNLKLAFLLSMFRTFSVVL